MRPHVRTRRSRATRRSRQCRKREGQDVRGGSPGTFEFGPNPSTAPEPGGFALPPTLFVQAAAVTPGILGGVGPPKQKRGVKIANGDWGNLYKLQTPNATRIPWGKPTVFRPRGCVQTSVQILPTLSQKPSLRAIGRECTLTLRPWERRRATRGAAAARSTRFSLSTTTLAKWLPDCRSRLEPHERGITQ